MRLTTNVGLCFCGYLASDSNYPLRHGLHLVMILIIITKSSYERNLYSR